MRVYMCVCACVCTLHTSKPRLQMYNANGINAFQRVSNERAVSFQLIKHCPISDKPTHNIKCSHLFQGRLSDLATAPQHSSHAEAFYTAVVRFTSSWSVTEASQGGTLFTALQCAAKGKTLETVVSQTSNRIWPLIRWEGFSVLWDNGCFIVFLCRFADERHTSITNEISFDHTQNQTENYSKLLWDEQWHIVM